MDKISKRNAYKTAQEYSWQKRAEKIINFIEKGKQHEAKKDYIYLEGNPSEKATP